MTSSRFTSAREQRLWTYLAVVMVAILATLHLAQRFALAVDTRWTTLLFIAACLMIMASVLTQGLSRQPGLLELAVAVAVAAAYILVFVRMTIATERSHLVEYGVVAALAYEALRERRRNGRTLVLPAAILAIGLASALGALDEAVQWFIPSRVFDPIDIAFNTLAAFMAVTAMAMLSWARNLVDARRNQRS